MNFTPLRDRLLVEKIERPQVTDSGIILKEYSKEKFAFGRVKSVGNDINDILLDNIVMFNPYSGTPLNLDNPYIMLSHGDVYGVVNDITEGYLTDINSFNIIHPKDVIIKVSTIKKDVVHSSGIILTSNASAVEDRPTKGIVVCRGTDINTVEIGDFVEFELTAGIDLEVKSIQGTHYVLMEIDRVIGKYLS